MLGGANKSCVLTSRGWCAELQSRRTYIQVHLWAGEAKAAKGSFQLGKGLSVEAIVAIGLYKLAHGQSYVPVMNQFRVGRSTAQKVCIEFNRAVWKMRKRFIRWKDKKATRAAFAKKGFPGCLGAIDGCHIPIKKPDEVGQAYKNYKGFNSIVLSGVVDENRRFCSVDIGSPGVNHDSHTYKTSAFCKYASKKNLGKFWGKP
jgi:hypothetical protein